MSRSQQQSVINTAASQNKTDFGNAQTELGNTQNDISDYKGQLAKFVSANPYTKGGEFDSTINTGLANASDAGSNSLKGALQSQTLRTGQNSAANAATAAEGARQNTRDLSSALAGAQQQRIQSEAGYNQTALGATSTPISADAGLYGSAGGQASGALNTQAGASQTPGFWDTLGDSFGSTLGKTLAGGNLTAVKQL